MSAADGSLCDVKVVLRKLGGSKIVILGVGNVLKGDDAAGPILCERIAAKVSAPVIDAGAVPENYIQRIKNHKPQNVLVIDVVDFGATPGTIQIFTREQLNSFSVSTHVLSPRLFADMVAKDITGGVYFIGIQPAHTHLGQPISVEVNHAIETVMAVLSQLFPLCPNTTNVI